MAQWELFRTYPMGYTAGVSAANAAMKGRMVSTVCGSIAIVGSGNPVVQWTPNTEYVVGDFVEPSGGPLEDCLFEVTTPGISHTTTEPTWNTTPGGTTVDNTVVYTTRNKAYYRSTITVDSMFGGSTLGAAALYIQFGPAADITMMSYLNVTVILGDDHEDDYGTPDSWSDQSSSGDMFCLAVGSSSPYRQSKRIKAVRFDMIRLPTAGEGPWYQEAKLHAAVLVAGA